MSDNNKDLKGALEGALAWRDQALAWRDRAYTERNTLACLVARCICETGGRAGWWIDADGEPGFRTVVAFDLPGGQVSFHMDERDAARPWETLPRYPGGADGAAPWDGHSDVEKWTRVRDFLNSPLGALRAFAARDQICAAGFPLTDPSQKQDDVPCAH